MESPMPIAEVEDTRIHYELAGAGPVVMLVAGTGYPGSTWPPDVLAALVPSFTVVTYDHRGTGKSPGTSGRYSTRLFAQDALALLQHLDLGPAHVLGHSMGGRVAQWMAHDGREQVRSLILAASGPGSHGEPDRPSMGIPVSAVVRLVELGYEGYIRDLQRRTFFTVDFANERPDLVRWLGDAFWDQRPSLEDYVKHVVARQSHDTVKILPSLMQPTLVMVGAEDTHEGGTGSHVEQSEYMAGVIPNSEFRMIPGVAHGLFWQESQVTMGIVVDWLTDGART